jgi:hypothetical protein
MKVLLLATAVLGGWAVNAQITNDLAVCVADAGSIPPDLHRLWKTELTRILDVTGHRLVLSCRPSSVELRFHSQHPGDSTALGAARTSGGAVLPKIELYISPVAELIGTNLPGLLGTALARITAHELAHYVKQECEHHKRGSFGAYYTAGMLLAGSPKHFRLPVPASD